MSMKYEACSWNTEALNTEKISIRAARRTTDMEIGGCKGKKSVYILYEHKYTGYVHPSNN